MKYLIDTDIASYYLRGLHLLDKMFEEKGLDEITLSDVTVAQMKVLAHKNPSSKINIQSIDSMAEICGVLEIDKKIWGIFSKIKAETLQCGEFKGDMDILQAAIARRHDLTVVTHNVNHFRGIVAFEDWVPPAIP